MNDMNERETVAVLLRVLMSGNAELDAMIREARRLDMATAAMRAIILHDMTQIELESTASSAFTIADALLAASESKKDEPIKRHWWGTTPPDAEGWIEWNGKNYCPTSEGACVEIILRGGMTIRSTTANAWNWNHCGKDGDIIAYRVVKDGQA